MNVFMVGSTGLLGSEAARIFIERGHCIRSRIDQETVAFSFADENFDVAVLELPYDLEGIPEDRIQCPGDGP